MTINWQEIAGTGDSYFLQGEWKAVVVDEKTGYFLHEIYRKSDDNPTGWEFMDADIAKERDEAKQRVEDWFKAQGVEL